MFLYFPYPGFELADIQRISNIQRLKSQGFTLEEIQRVYSGSGRQELEALYREKIAEMERKIAYDNHVLARMSASARTLQTAQEQLMRPVRLSLGRVYLLEYPSVLDMWARVEKEPLLASHYYVLRPNTKNPYKQLYVNN